MNIKKNKGIALNRALKENLLTIFISIINCIPLIIVGKPVNIQIVIYLKI